VLLEIWSAVEAGPFSRITGSWFTISLRTGTLDFAVFSLKSSPCLRFIALSNFWLAVPPNKKLVRIPVPNLALKSDPTCTAWFPLFSFVFHNFVQLSVAGWAA
jgi:hypothetical protein